MCFPWPYLVPSRCQQLMTDTARPCAPMPAAAPSRSTVACAVAGYATCSSLMLVVNKVAVHFLPAPSFLLLVQVAVSAAAVKGCGALGWIDVDELEWGKFRSFFPVAAAFLACIYANIKTLQYSNVETFIVFRNSTPPLIGIAEWALMGRELPNCRSAASMLLVICAASAYVMTDASFVVRGYVWVAIWYVIFSFDQLYIKHAVDTVKMRSNWGRVFYTNLIAACMLFVVTLALEPATLLGMHWGPKLVGALLVSCVIGVGISYYAFLCRASVSATSFTVIGNVSKILTVVINVLIWNKHASPVGLGMLFVCLAAAALYQQAPMRADATADASEVAKLQAPAEGDAKTELDSAEEFPEADDEQKLAGRKSPERNKK